MMIETDCSPKRCADLSSHNKLGAVMACPWAECVRVQGGVF